MLDAIQRIQSYTEGLDLETLGADRRTLDAVERNLILIGEAAAHVPTWVTTRFPDVPWRLMSDMRNVVVHKYWGIDIRQLWDTIHHDIPPLIPLLQQVLE